MTNSLICWAAPLQQLDQHCTARYSVFSISQLRKLLSIVLNTGHTSINWGLQRLGDLNKRASSSLDSLRLPPTVSELKTAKASTYPPNIHRFCVNLFDTMSFSLSSSTATTTCRSLRNAAPSARTLPSLPLGTRARSPTLRPWRAFASSAGRELAVSEMSERDFASLKVDQDRLMNDIHTTSEWGKGEPWGE